MRPPSTACSASTECGGIRMSSTAALSRARQLPASDTMASVSGIGLLYQLCESDARLFFRNDDDRQVDGHIGVQVQLHDVLASLADRAVGQAHFRAFDLMAR